MADQIAKYETYASDIKRMVILTGLWPGPVSWELYRYLPIIHVLTALMASTAIINFVMNHISNIALVTRGLSISFSLLSAIQKVIVLTINRDYLIELHRILDETFHQDFAHDELRPKLLSGIAWFYRPTLVLSLSTYFLLPMYMFVPPISILLQYIHGVSPIKYRLPFPSQYPWATSDNLLVFGTHYIIEACAGFAVAGITAATDALFGFYIFQMTSQFRTLSHRMSNLKATDDYETVIKECAVRHQTLTHCRDNLEQIYGPIILWMLTTSAMIMCALIYQTSHMSLEKAIVFSVYIVMKLMQTLLYGWFGMSLTSETEAFRESVYCSDWPGSGEKSFMSNVLIMITCKPLILTACKFSVIGLDMFLAITNTAVSYFFLLQTLEEK
nr:olfactory receptor 50 [Gregopimpla kuwanae]